MQSCHALTFVTILFTFRLQVWAPCASTIRLRSKRNNWTLPVLPTSKNSHPLPQLLFPIPPPLQYPSCPLFPQLRYYLLIPLLYQALSLLLFFLQFTPFPILPLQPSPTFPTALAHVPLGLNFAPLTLRHRSKYQWRRVILCSM